MSTLDQNTSFLQRYSQLLWSMGVVLVTVAVTWGATTTRVSALEQRIGDLDQRGLAIHKTADEKQVEMLQRIESHLAALDAKVEDVRGDVSEIKTELRSTRTKR